MTASIVKFQFTGEPDPEAIETDVALAIFVAECVYGKPRVRLETAYSVEPNGESCVLDIRGEAGEIAARIFAGLTATRLGEQAYTVCRISPVTH